MLESAFPHFLIHSDQRGREMPAFWVGFPPALNCLAYVIYLLTLNLTAE